ncbi:MAG: hypothetical protein ACR2N3_11015 [Pyrinomonadaceae bacterium]
MSELSPVYSEYEKVSSLFRRLNEATLVARQTMLGLKTPSSKHQIQVQQELESALEELSENEKNASNLTFADILSELQKEDVDVSESNLNSIRQRVRRGLQTLTNEDIEIIEKVTDVLDSKSELLFRRIQK